MVGPRGSGWRTFQVRHIYPLHTIRKPESVCVGVCVCMYGGGVRVCVWGAGVCVWVCGGVCVCGCVFV